MGKSRWSPLLAAIFLQLGCACGGEAAPASTAGSNGSGATASNDGGGSGAGAQGDGGTGTGSGGIGASGSGGTTAVEAETLGDGAVALSNPRVRLFGRWARGSDGSVKGNWGPIGFRLRFESPSVAVSLKDEGANLGEEGTGSVYQVRVDDGPPQVLPKGQAQLTLASGLAAGVHTLEFVRRNESRFGITTLRSLQLAPGSRLYDAGERPLRLEVLGDSISAGLANENT